MRLYERVLAVMRPKENDFQEYMLKAFCEGEELTESNQARLEYYEYSLSDMKKAYLAGASRNLSFDMMLAWAVDLLDIFIHKESKIDHIYQGKDLLKKLKAHLP